MTAYEATRIGVLLANTGTPKSPEPRDVRRYLGRFLMDERIRPMAKAPWWLILHLFILPTRSVKSGRKYGKIWTEAGSPFDVEHAKLRNLLEQLLQGDGMDVRVQVGQSYGEDSIQAALAALREQGCTQVVVLPLYPQSAPFDHVERQGRRCGGYDRVVVAGAADVRGFLWYGQRLYRCDRPNCFGCGLQRTGRR